MDNIESKMFRFGADYYPEHWPEARWHQDIELMKEAGFNVVRLAEFAWSMMEPEEGEFDFEWLDRVIALLKDHQIDVVLGTPTASPPPWLMSKDNDFFLVNQDGNRLTYGGRREYCPNHPVYHHYTKIIVREMASHYADNPAVIGWQIDNEFGDRCYCEICRQAFQKWLKARYGNLDVLNEKWGTNFWSHVYTDWAQIPVPLTTSRSHNPSLALDYRRFMSDTYRAYQKFQIDILRKHIKNQFITHNLMGFGYNQLNYYDNSEDLDFVSWDNYLRTQWNPQANVDRTSAALSADTMRGLKKRNFWVMEQQSGGGGWEMVAVPPKPGELRLWTYQSIAHGADGILYFRWRTCHSGTEQFWQGILEHHGIPGRRYQEVAQVGEELKKIGEILCNSEVRPQAAIMQSYDSRFAFQVQPNNLRFSYEKHLRDIYRGFHDANIPVDIISEKDDLGRYKVVLVPSMYVLTSQTADNLRAFARSGGLVVFTPRTGVKNEDNKIVNMKLPGLVAELAGVEVEEYISMPMDEDNKIQFKLPNLDLTLSVSTWADVLIPTTAKTAAYYIEDYYKNRAAVTVNTFGEGKVVYLGTFGEASFYQEVTKWIVELAKLSSLLKTPPGIEVTERWQGYQRYFFLLNHTAESKTVSLEKPFTEIITDRQIITDSEIQPYEVWILTPS